MRMAGVIIEVRIFSELIGYMAVAVGLILYHRLETPRWQSSEWRQSVLSSCMPGLSSVAVRFEDEDRFTVTSVVPPLSLETGS